MMRLKTTGTVALATILAIGCGDDPADRPPLPEVTEGRVVAVNDTVIAATIDATGMTAPIESATLSTKLMGSVEQVLVIEGERVTRDQLLVRLDLRDLTARRSQAEAMLADAEAQRDLAEMAAIRVRALHADSAAPQATLDAAESALVRAALGVRAAMAGLAELAAATSYGEVRAPFDGVVMRRFVDPGAFVGPGAPLLLVDRAGALRVTATVPAAVAALLKPGDTVIVAINGEAHLARMEGTARSGAGTWLVNAVLPNADGTIMSGSAATISLPAGNREALLVPTAALTIQGDLTTLLRRTAQGDLLTVVRTGQRVGDFTAVHSGLTVGDSVVIRTGSGRR
jgi:RND family efflux transporter MFP subunit